VSGSAITVHSRGHVVWLALSSLSADVNFPFEFELLFARVLGADRVREREGERGSEREGNREGGRANVNTPSPPIDAMVTLNTADEILDLAGRGPEVRQNSPVTVAPKFSGDRCSKILR
jgi:hypothetical protein